MTALEVELRTAHRDLHSGTHGGSIQNPNHALATLLAGLHESDGGVAVDGFYDVCCRYAMCSVATPLSQPTEPLPALCVFQYDMMLLSHFW
jgi:hypothetical protein